MKLKMIWLTSLIATLGSLYFSEVRGFIPCELCWYQRILMYPLSVLFLVGVLRNELKIVYYTLPLSLLGMCVSAFHYAKQKVAWFDDATGVCSTGIPCSGMYINWFGFVTIPFLALIAFSIINIISFLIIRETKKL